VETARFVIQEHTTPDGVHWDLMLERQGTLLTFRLPVPPAQAASAPTAATKIHDHPLRFLAYEGPVQNHTGRVRIADRGTLEIKTETEDRLTVVLAGEILRGVFSLIRTRDAEWTFSA
jgi:hypothetical protein